MGNPQSKHDTQPASRRFQYASQNEQHASANPTTVQPVQWPQEDSDTTPQGAETLAASTTSDHENRKLSDEKPTKTCTQW